MRVLVDTNHHPPAHSPGQNLIEFWARLHPARRKQWPGVGSGPSITHVMTFNGDDFRRFPGTVPLHPQDIQEPPPVEA